MTHLVTNKVLQYIELDIDYCSLTYSVSPCTASLVNSPATGTIKCFNTLATCQDRANFTNVPVTLRFAVPTDFLPSNIECIPNIKDISFDPSVVSLGKDLGQRATLTVNFFDHRHSDTGAGFDKYLADSPSSRDYNPYEQGTFWGKFRKRQQFMHGVPIRWIQGSVDEALADMEVRHFIVDSFAGPDNNGNFRIVAKDPLKLADGDKALAPVANTGSLIADLTAVATTCTLTPTGIGNEEYAVNGGVAIGGSEICSFTRSGDVLTLGRGYNGVATTHNAGDRVQTVLFYTATDPANIIYDLLVNYTSINAGDIDLTAWQAETTSYLNRLYTARIAQPTSVNTLVSEIIEQAGLSMWWDDRNQTVGLLVLHGLVNDALFSDDNMLANSFEVTEQFDKRLTQVHVYFGQINWLTSLSDKANYRSVSKSIDTQAESDYGSPIIKEIFSRWIPALGDSTADRVGSILLSRFRDPPRHIKTSFIRDSVDEIALARGYQIQSWPMQDETGAAETVNVQVTRLRPMANVIEVEADEVLFTAAAEDLTVRQIVVSSDAHNINLRTSHDLLFPTPAAGITVVCTVNSGIRIGSTISSAIALDIGTWPAGVTIVVFISGGIRGAGGKGGDWGAGVGIAGGTALYTRYAINLALDGTLWGGGGGGGASLYSPVAGFGGAGGGGAGFDPGLGGQGNGGTGATGTETAGGAAFTFGGPGGGAGLVGVAGSTIIEGGFTYPGQAGGAAGRAIDGVSFVTTGSWDGTTFTPGALGGDLRGSQVN